MGIFRNGPMSRRHQAAAYHPPAQSRPAPPPAKPAAPPAPVDKVVAPTPAASPNKQSTGSADVLTGALGKLFKAGGDMVQSGQDLLKASKGVQLTPEERAQVQQAAGVMERLAGADGMWNRGDLANNVKQLERSGDLGKAVNQEIGRRWGQELSQRGLIGRALVNGHMNRNYGKYQQQGMNQARGMANQQLSQGMGGAGVKADAGHKADKTTPEGLKKSGEAISRADMEKFQKTMDMLQEKSKAQGLPQVSFPNGVPAQFLKDIGAGKNPQEALKEAGAVLKLKNGQSFDLGKMPQTAPAKEAEKATQAAKEAETAVKESAQGASAAQEEKSDSPTQQAATAESAETEAPDSQTPEAEAAAEPAAETQPEPESEPQPEAEPEPQPAAE